MFYLQCLYKIYFNHVVPLTSPISSSSMYPRNRVIFSPFFLKQNKTKKLQNHRIKVKQNKQTTIRQKNPNHKNAKKNTNSLLSLFYVGPLLLGMGYSSKCS